jgi:predicted nucleic acid-binding protein
VNLVILDTSVLVNDLRSGMYEERMQSLAGLIRFSSVVLAELWRGAVTREERDLLLRLARNHPVLTPTEKHWIESGQILNRIRADLGFTPDKLRTLHFDVLIALTARSHGARLITANARDFGIIEQYRKFDLEVWKA